MILKFVTEPLVKRKLNNTENKRLKACNLNNTWKFSLETKVMRKLWSLCLRLRRRCEIQGRTGGIVGVAVMAVVVMAISKQLVHLGGVTSGAPLLVAQMSPSEGELVAVNLAGVCLS